MSRQPMTAARKYEELSPSNRSILERYGITAETFNQVRGQDQARELERDGGSQMVRDDRAAPRHAPAPDLARDPERENFNQRWGDEIQRARDAQERENTPSPEPDRSR